MVMKLGSIIKAAQLKANRASEPSSVRFKSKKQARRHYANGGEAEPMGPLAAFIWRRVKDNGKKGTSE
jgi:hypothetical protein